MRSFIFSAITNPFLIPNYVREITELVQVIALWIFINNHQLTEGLTSNSLQTPTTQALTLISAILLHVLGCIMTV